MFRASVRVSWGKFASVLAVAVAAFAVFASSASADVNGVSVSPPTGVAPGATAVFVVTITNMLASPPYVPALSYWWTGPDGMAGSINHLNSGQTRSEKTRLTAPSTTGLWCPVLTFFSDFTVSDQLQPSGGVFVAEVAVACVDVG
jgi:hypothetical protein